MVALGSLVRLEARQGKDAGVDNFLQTARRLVGEEPGMTAWFAIRFGRMEYGIVDVFPDEATRQAHLAGEVAQSLTDQAGVLFAQVPRIQQYTVLAHKLPATAPVDPDTKALLITFKAKAGHEQQVEQFLRGAQPLVEQEPKTTAWIAIRFDEGGFGIFDAFPDNGGRFAHLTGHVPRELAKHALSLLGSVPEIEMLNVIAEKLGAQAE